MKAGLLLRERHPIGDESFVELKVWRVPRSVRGSVHRYKYSLAYVVRGVCVVRYDNEAGKGDHRHVGKSEATYRFSTIDRLLDELEETNPEWCRLVEVKYFLGLTEKEAADALCLKLRTMQRMWLEARQWLFAQKEAASATPSAG